MDDMDFLTNVLVTAPRGAFRAEKKLADGRTAVFRGLDLKAFLEHKDERKHEHWVWDADGNLVYYRDKEGYVHWGTGKQMLDAAKKRKVGIGAVAWTTILTDALRKAIEFNKRGLQGRL